MKPKENIFRTKFRTPIDNFLIKLPWPKINPNYISLFTIITTLVSAAFFLIKNLWLFWIFLLITLLLDWVDGTIARKYNLATLKGWLFDKIIDRISEAILFLVIWPIGLIFVALNILMMIFSYKGKYPFLLMLIPPLRIVLLVVYFIKLVF